MNKRIKELIAQATSIQGPTPYNPLTFEVFDKEKFAELLIQECCGVINAAKPGVDQLPPEVALDMAAKNVKAYFGVDK